ncbi:MAG: M1 family metallopeptidase [Nocardioides sp.]
MHPSRLTAAVTIGAALLLTPGAGFAGASVDGTSQPREDSYYPAKGDPGVDVLHYGLDLDWRRSARTLVGHAVLDVRATGPTNSFRLDLHSAMQVSSVKVDGSAVNASHTGKTLTVPLTAEVPADSRHVLEVDYRGTPQPVRGPSTRPDMQRIGMRVTKDGQLRTMQEPFGAFTWYPVNDHPSDKALYDITVESPSGWSGIANGTMSRLPANGDRPVTAWHLSQPAASYLVTLAVGPYAHRSLTGPHGLPLHFWVPRQHVSDYMRVLRNVPRDLVWLEDKLGPYPFETAGAVIVPGGSAMETQTLVTFGARLFGRGAREIMVHELAHQWYGDTVTPNDWTGLWLNEGMAMYLQARWNVEHTSTQWSLWREEFEFGNSFYRKTDGPPAAYKRKHFAESCVYYCTALMYDHLRERLGNRSFYRLVRQWPQTHLNSSADKATFVNWVESETGRELSPFFNRWLLSPTWPPS